MPYIEQLAEFLNRRPQARQQRRHMRQRVGYALAMSLLATAFIFAFGAQILCWKRIESGAKIAESDWHINSAANPSKNPAEWAEIRNPVASHRRAYAIHSEHFYLGATVSAEALHAAQKAGANQLMLGWINASYHLWLDGEEVERSAKGGDVILLTIPFARLAQEHPMQIIFSVENTAHHPRPDNLSYFFGRDLGEGFYTKENALAYRKLLSFVNEIRPITLLLANFLVSIFFFTLWVYTKRKDEYYYMAIYTLVGTGFQLLNTSFLFERLPLDIYYSCNAIVILSEGFFGALLGFSFARCRKEIFYVFYYVLIAFALTVCAFYSNSSALYSVGRMINNQLIPALYLLGAMACYVQCYALTQKTHFSLRAQRLLYFGLAMTLFAAFTYAQALFWSEIPFIENMLLYRFTHFGLVIFLGTIVLQEYHHERILLEKTPISPYHRRPNLPEQLSGIILSLDFKNSESLFRLASEEGNAGDIVHTCLTHAWSLVAEHQGVIVHTEGDSLLAFFDDLQCTTPMQSAIRATQELALRLANLEQQYQGNFETAEVVLQFRASIVGGAIRPIWQNIGEQRQASWIETGNTNPLVTASRLLEIEKTLAKELALEHSVVLIEENLLQQSIPMLRWVIRDAKRPGKHGVQYHFSAYGFPESKAMALPKTGSLG